MKRPPPTTVLHLTGMLACVALCLFCAAGCKSASSILDTLELTGHVLEGRVVDTDDGRAIADAQVTNEERTLPVDHQGSFQIALDIGMHLFEASAPGYLGGSFTVTVQEETPRRYEQTFALSRRLLLGYVFDGLTDQPVVAAELRYGDERVRTDPRGYFEVLAPHPAALSVSCAGYLPVELLAEVVATLFDATGKLSQPLQIELAPRLLTGKVTEKGSGEPLAGAAVALGDMTTLTDTEGQYELRYVEEQGALSFSSPEHRPLTNISYSGQTEQDVALAPWEVTLTVIDQGTGGPLAGAQVASPRRTQVTDGQGHILVRVAPDAPVSVSYVGYLTATVAYGGEEELAVSLRPTRLIGQLSDISASEVVSHALILS